jgi:hypothetical protein
MTGSGFYGTLTEVTDDTVMLQLAPALTVKLARRAVAAKVTPPAAAGDETIEEGAGPTATPSDAPEATEAPEPTEAPEQHGGPSLPDPDETEGGA